MPSPKFALTATLVLSTMFTTNASSQSATSEDFFFEHIWGPEYERLDELTPNTPGINLRSILKRKAITDYTENRPPGARLTILPYLRDQLNDIANNTDADILATFTSQAQRQLSLPLPNFEEISDDLTIDRTELIKLVTAAGHLWADNFIQETGILDIPMSEELRQSARNFAANFGDDAPNEHTIQGLSFAEISLQSVLQEKQQQQIMQPPSSHP